MRLFRFLAVVWVGLFAFGLMAYGENIGTKDVSRVTFLAATRVGGELLPAGDYVVRHTMEGGNHVMVFQSVNHKHADVKVKCQLVQLGKKADQTRMVYELNAANERVLQELVFGGDTAKHVF